MKRYLKIELFDEGAEAIERIATITKRKVDEAVSDALTTYLWVLHQQTFGARVLSKKEDFEDPLDPLVKNTPKAREYFGELGW